MVTLEFIKHQLSIDPDDTTDDFYLELLIRAATKHVENFTNRKLIAVGAVKENETDLECADDVVLGMMLLIGGWYAVRENISDVKVQTIPFGFAALVGPYKYIPM